MPCRPTGSLPRIRKRSDSNTARVTLGGRTFSLGEFGTSESEARYHDLCRLWIEAGRPRKGFNPEGKPTDEPREPTIDDVVIAYAESLKRKWPDKPNGTPHREFSSRRPALRLWRRLFGTSLAKDFGPKKFKLLRQSILETGVSRQHANQVMANLRHAIRWATSEELMSGSQLEAIRSVQPLRLGDIAGLRETEPVQPVSDEMFKKTLPFLPEIVADLLQVQRLSGARCKEICEMRPCDLEIEEEKWLYKPSKHKTMYKGKQRSIVLGPRAQSILSRYLKRPSSSFMFSPSEQLEITIKQRIAKAKGHRRTPRVKVASPKRSPGEKYSTDSVRRSVYRACEQAFPVPVGMSNKEAKEWRRQHKWSPHQLRHAAATDIRRQTSSLDLAQSVLGHCDPRTTARYAEVDLSSVVDLMRAIG